jgi:hypothetical protein
MDDYDEMYEALQNVGARFIGHFETMEGGEIILYTDDDREIVLDFDRSGNYEGCRIEEIE